MHSDATCVKRLIDAARTPMALVTATGGIRHANASFRRMTGLDHGDITPGRGIARWLDPGDSGAIARAIRDAGKTGEAGTIRATSRISRVTRPARGWHVLPLAPGGPILIQPEDRPDPVRGRRRRRAIESLTGIGSWQADPVDETLIWSEHAFMVLGRNMTQGPPALETMPAYFRTREAERLGEAFETLLDTGAGFDLESRCVTETGQTIRLRATGRCDREDDGALYGTFEDVTADHAQRRHFQRLEALAEKTTNAVIMTDADGRVEWANPVSEKLTGYSMAEMLGQKPGLLLKSDKKDEATVARVRDAVSAGRPVQAELINRSKDGRDYWVALDIQPLYGESGELAGFVAIETDITELQEAKARAETASRAKSAFLANMSHEIRTPMNGILGLVELLSETPLAADQREQLDTIRASAEALMAILNDILDLARIESGKLNLDRRPFPLDRIVRRVAAMHRANAQQKGLALHTDISLGNAPMREGDPTRVQQVLHNLMGNAVKFTETGSVSLTVSAGHGNDVSLTVQDTGIGMTGEQAARIFGEFEQADSTISRRFGGTGLGLSIVHRLVDRMGGAIGFDTAPDVGTTATVILPLPPVHSPASPGPDGADHAAGGATDLQGLRVLAAEDNRTNRRILSAMLARLGLDITLCRDGRRAVDTWKPGAFDLLVLDVSMPGLDGPDALEAISEHAASSGCAAPPAIAATAHAMPDQVAALHEAGFAGVVTKPMTRAALARVISLAISGAGP